MDIQKRALYNSLRMNWLIDTKLQVESWQVENYREMTLPLIFSRLRQHGLDFNKESFCVLAEDFQTPEELNDNLLEEQEIDPETEDRIYLLIFELWRRLETDKPCLSVFCDELDHQIFLYDHGKTQNVEDLQDALANLQVILDENVDQGVEPIDVMEIVNEGCANDVVTFLYDFISEQIDNENFSYAQELLDNFIDYVVDAKWFDFLRVRIFSHTDPEGANILIEQLAQEACIDPDLQFKLEILSELIQEGEHKTFVALAKSSAELLETEEDFQDLVSICADFYRRQDDEKTERALQEILRERSKNSLDQRFTNKDKHLTRLLNLIK